MRCAGLPRRDVVLGLGALAGTIIHPGIALAASEDIKFGLTPVFLTNDLELLARLKTYLERATGRPVRLVTRRTYQEITSLLISGQLDAAWICGFPLVANPQLALVAVPIWRGKPLYQSYLIAGRDRLAGSLDDLEGDVHAFSDPDSNSGWLVTAAALAERNRTPERFFRQTIVTWGHRNVIRAVASGLAESGSVDGYVYEVMRETDPDLVGETRIVRDYVLLVFRRSPRRRPSSRSRGPVSSGWQPWGWRTTRTGGKCFGSCGSTASARRSRSSTTRSARRSPSVRGAAG